MLPKFTAILEIEIDDENMTKAIIALGTEQTWRCRLVFSLPSLIQSNSLKRSQVA